MCISIIVLRFFQTAFVAIAFISCKKDSDILNKQKAEIVLSSARLSSDNINLVRDTVYILVENLQRNANQELIIEAGTLIKVKNNVGVQINSGGKLVAIGTKDEPIVFTSDALEGTAGHLTNYWRGLMIDGPAEAKLSYVRIEFAGGGFTPSLLLRNIDSTTTLNDIQVSYSVTRAAFEFSGGNCNAYNLLSFAAANTDFKLSNGYTGKLQNLLAYRLPYFGGGPTLQEPLAGLFLQGSNTFPSISNYSVIGPDLQPGTSTNYSPPDAGFGSFPVASLLVSNTAKFHIRNAVLAGFPKGGFYISSPESGISLQSGESDFTYSFVHSNDSSRAFYIPANLIPLVPPVTAKDFKVFMLQPKYHNQLILKTLDLQLTDPYNYDYDPNPIPKQGSPLLSGANFETPVFNDPFFKKVNYRGAIGEDNWLETWTNFIPLQTDYNN